jgi:hypothetical protein
MGHHVGSEPDTNSNTDSDPNPHTNSNSHTDAYTSARSSGAS